MDDAFNPFPEAERKIFAYHDGFKPVFGDPLEIEARYLHNLAGVDLAEIDKALASKDIQTSLKATERMLPAVRAAFRLLPFDEDTGKGLTREEVMRLFDRYSEWKKKFETSTEDGHSEPSPPVDGLESP